MVADKQSFIIPIEKPLLILKFIGGFPFEWQFEDGSITSIALNKRLWWLMAFVNFGFIVFSRQVFSQAVFIQINSLIFVSIDPQFPGILITI